VISKPVFVIITTCVISVQPPRNIRSSSTDTITRQQPSSSSKLLLVALSVLHHTVCGINFPLHIVSLKY